MIDYLKEQILLYYDNDVLDKVISCLNIKRKTTIRINRLKTNIDIIKKELDENNIKYELVDWYEDALIIDDEKKLRQLDIYKNGLIYFQSLSSMIPPLILEPKDGESILDMAASPGSKTTQIASMTLDKTLITAVEKNKIRADRLKYNLKLQGVNRVTVLNEDASKLDEFFRFDKILLDSPCSGSGTLDSNSLSYFNSKLVNKCINTQKELINKAIKLLKTDGILIYSTCSILKSENEEIVNYILKNNNVVLEKIELSKNIPTLKSNIDGCITVCPTNYFEGFFVAKIRKIRD